MLHKYTESETESYYDGEDAVYRALWDKDGIVHWGLFDETTGRNFIEAARNLNRFMRQRGVITEADSLIDVGCGSGTNAIWLASETGCRATGIDLSGVRIENAQDALTREPLEIQARTAFHKASATDLPFEEGSFTRAWSQATIYHVPDKEAVLREVYRVLAPGGVFVFDDLTKPNPEIGEDARQYVYERLLYDTDFSFESYQQALKDAGFQILEAHDFSGHLKTSYECLSELAGRGDPEHQERFDYLHKAYAETALAVTRGEVGWAAFVCKK
jgi:ubiquinone/menaquinone biosynthesis C-methylase UbiE